MMSSGNGSASPTNPARLADCAASTVDCRRRIGDDTDRTGNSVEYERGSATELIVRSHSGVNVAGASREIRIAIAVHFD